MLIDDRLDSGCTAVFSIAAVWRILAFAVLGKCFGMKTIGDDADDFFLSQFFQKLLDQTLLRMAEFYDQYDAVNQAGDGCGFSR
ncbi:MAG: hypothetical protein QNI97_13665 [Desulfobacterales bacterium]|nr:hypothetical protein [Desulfobacterales bacterium]